MKIEWKKKTHAYSSGEVAFLGKVAAGSVHYDSCRSKGEPNAWAYHVDLPGIKTQSTRFRTIEEAKARLEKAVGVWLEWAGLNG